MRHSPRFRFREFDKRKISVQIDIVRVFSSPFGKPVRVQRRDEIQRRFRFHFTRFLDIVPKKRRFLVLAMIVVLSARPLR